METIIPNLYQQLGEFFTGTFRRRLLKILILEIYFGLIILGHRYNFIISKETLDLVFSSIIQALLSLVALLGVAAFFKLEALRLEEDKIIEMAITQLDGGFISSGEELMMRLNDLVNLGGHSPLLLVFKERLEGVLFNKKFTRNYIINFTILSFFTVLASLVLLVIVPILISYELSILSLVIITTLVANCLFLVIKGVADSVYY